MAYTFTRAIVLVRKPTPSKAMSPSLARNVTPDLGSTTSWASAGTPTERSTRAAIRFTGTPSGKILPRPYRKETSGLAGTCPAIDCLLGSFCFCNNRTRPMRHSPQPKRHLDRGFVHEQALRHYGHPSNQPGIPVGIVSPDQGPPQHTDEPRERTLAQDCRHGGQFAHDTYRPDAGYDRTADGRCSSPAGLRYVRDQHENWLRRRWPRIHHERPSFRPDSRIERQVRCGAAGFAVPGGKGSAGLLQSQQSVGRCNEPWASLRSFLAAWGRACFS